MAQNKIGGYVGVALIAAALGFIAARMTTTSEAKEKTQTTKAQPEKQFSSLMFDEIVPIVDGGAYAISFGEGIYYLRGDQAHKVRESKDQARTAATLPSSHISANNREKLFAVRADQMRRALLKARNETTKAYEYDGEYGD